MQSEKYEGYLCFYDNSSHKKPVPYKIMYKTMTSDVTDQCLGNI